MERIELVPGFWLERVDEGLYRVRGPEMRHEALLTEAEASAFATTIMAARSVSNMDGFLQATEALLENAKKTGKDFPVMREAAQKVRHERDKLEAILNMQSDVQEVKGTA